MSKYKVCVYAISKNEEKFVQRWYNSIKDADYICVLDTGSDDNTVSELKKLGVNVKVKKIKPWRFDEARNESMKMIPKDAQICICLDLDEVMLDGWKEKLLSIWNDNITRLWYKYNWNLDENDNPLISFYANKIHKNENYRWIYPVHEVLEYSGENEVYARSEELIINHYPDSSKSRSSYLPLLELSIKENPNDDRNMHYLGREYMYYGKWQESIDTLLKHLSLPSSTWKDERCASMRFIARCYKNLLRYNEAEMWLKKAIDEAPYLRDSYIEMASLKYILKKWNDVIYYSNEALKIKNNSMSYINEKFSYDETVYDLLSLAYYYIGDISNAILYSNKALEINPLNDRIKNNKKYFESLS